MQGYAVRSFTRGRLALAAAAQNPPDVILLDVLMPEMDGFEVSREIPRQPGAFLRSGDFPQRTGPT